MMALFSKLPIRLKFALSSILILVLVSGILLTYFSIQQEKQALKLIENNVQNMAEMVALGVGIALNSNNFQAIHETLIWARKDVNLTYILVFNTEGKEIANLKPENLPENSQDLIQQVGIVKVGKFLNSTVSVRFSDNDYGKLILGYSLEDMYDKILTNLIKGIIICLGILLFGVLFTIIISNVLTKHIRQLSEAANDFTRGKHDVEISITSSDEIGELGIAFNLMIKTIRRHFQNLAKTNEQLEDEIGERRSVEKELIKSKERLRNLSNRLQSVREEEKSHIAREIHDELGQVLTGLNLDLAWLEKKIPESEDYLLSKIDSMSSSIESTVQRVHQIITELRPQILDVLGLCDALKWQTREFQKRTGIECRLTLIPDNIELDSDQSIALFRIYQESLTNVARHAKASKVKARFQKHQGMLELEIIDNGKGIEKDQISNETSFGLLGIRERALVWGGSVNIFGIPGKGTTLTVTLPYKTS